MLSIVLGSLPRRAALLFGRTVGRIAWFLSGRDRRRALDHLALAFPDMPGEERHRIARQSFLFQGMNAAELLHLLRRDADEVLPHIEILGWENLEAARAAGRPVLVLTGHCGNWELMAVPTRARGYPLAAIARPLDDPRLQELLVSVRRHLGSITIARGTRGAARQILGVLRSGGAIAMLIDQDTKVDGVWVPFFGRPAFTPVGAAEMALKQNMRVVPAFLERRPDGGHLLRFLPVLDLPGDPREATARMTAEIEEQIRRRPEQWVWWHKRWRRQPPEGA
ncbi:MAG TPA: lysophospholipid acyltransferase family protein [Thermoanaerobaculia bacterium]|nr:lysophospholipid acyltransferase family protein [Thermoanaerobaculia bacterium]